MTLVYRPPLNRDFGAEFVRVNVDAHLRQEQDDTFASRVKQVYLPKESDDVHFEHELIEHGLKWWPIKAYRARFPQGKGKSSNWRLSVESLVRSEEAFPPSGVYDNADSSSRECASDVLGSSSTDLHVGDDRRR